MRHSRGRENFASCSPGRAYGTLALLMFGDLVYYGHDPQALPFVLFRFCESSTGSSQR